MRYAAKPKTMKVTSRKRIGPEVSVSVVKAVNNAKTFGNTPFNTPLDTAKIDAILKENAVFPDTITSITDLRNMENVALVLDNIRKIINGVTDTNTQEEPTPSETPAEK